MPSELTRCVGVFCLPSVDHSRWRCCSTNTFPGFQGMRESRRLSAAVACPVITEWETTTTKETYLTNKSVCQKFTQVCIYWRFSEAILRSSTAFQQNVSLPATFAYDNAWHAYGPCRYAPYTIGSIPKDENSLLEALFPLNFLSKVPVSFLARRHVYFDSFFEEWIGNGVVL